MPIQTTEENPKAFKVESTDNNSLSPRYLRKNMPGFIVDLNAKKRGIVFVDANNWYHNLKKYFNPGDIDISLISKFIAEKYNLEIIEIRWYISMPSIADGELMYKKQRNFLGMLEKKGVKVITRKLQRLSNKEVLKKKKETIENLDLCNNCKPLVESSFLDLSDIKRKEKGIDVWIAIDMVKKSIIDNECDVCLLISGDADFVPALELIKGSKKEVLSSFVPWGYSSELRNKFNYFLLFPSILRQCFRDYKNK